MRPRILPPRTWAATALSLAMASLAVAAPAQGEGLSASASSVKSSARDVILECTNAERAKHGLSPLRASWTLRRAAQYHAENMLRNRFFAHDDNFGRNAAERVAKFEKSHNFHYIGENIAAGYGSARAACRSWVVSTKHRHNILDRDYKWLGVGFASGDRGYGTYFVQNFGG